MWLIIGALQQRITKIEKKLTEERERKLQLAIEKMKKKKLLEAAKKAQKGSQSQISDVHMTSSESD